MHTIGKASQAVHLGYSLVSYQVESGDLGTVLRLACFADLCQQGCSTAVLCDCFTTGCYCTCVAGVSHHFHFRVDCCSILKVEAGCISLLKL